ncbi:hypothetical protein JJV70_07395 [Streptomyces sp. JJ66]|uniref:hypothetical protein n=1 Tax=Streptomyces sp. JJ66 TaxID=2803843 RepID=UPI001C575C6C|nr:hypothetical protein [Streptomyces sp. JJ66]MBW1601937.1 hypothetical protein [Streptomyces sp. JJ66]
MAVSRRPLVTSAVAGGLLFALWFVPSANASGEAVPASASVPDTAAPAEAADLQLADTGSFDSAPYVGGGVTFLAAGAGLLVHANRRARA